MAQQQAQAFNHGNVYLVNDNTTIRWRRTNNTQFVIPQEAQANAITRIEMAGSGITPADFEILCRQYLRYCTNITFIYVIGNGTGFGDGGMKALVDMLGVLPKLDTIALDKYNITVNGVEHLRDAILQYSFNPDKLKVLSLSGNKFGDDGMKALKALGKMTSLKQLYLAKNNITVNGVEHLRHAILPPQSPLNLEVLTLSGNGFGDAGMEALSGLVRMTSLTELYLAGNAIKGERHLPIPANLQVLSLSENLLGDHAMKHLGLPNTLRELYLAKNKINETGAKNLCNALRNPTMHTNLRVLDLSGNQLGDGGASAVVEGLREIWGNQVLPGTKLDLGVNGVSDETKEQVRTAPQFVEKLWLDPENKDAIPMSLACVGNLFL